ncbi:unnamed protein product [Urochloa humidicola]
MGFDTTQNHVCSLWEVQRPATIPAKHYNSFLLLVSWHLWKHRNAIVFNDEPASQSRFWANCREDAHLWSMRWPAAERQIAESWCLVLSSM